jgi:hypothetical protein
MTADGTPPPDFELEFYKLHRAHEVALNSATATYEQAILKLILVLNAASVGVLIGLVQANGPDSWISFNFSAVMGAIYVWVFGIFLAFVASVYGYLSQRDFTKAHLARRRAIEEARVVEDTHQRLTKWYSRLDTSDRDKFPKPTDGVEFRKKEADECHTRAGKRQSVAYWLGGAAVATAVIGFAVAVSSIGDKGRRPATATSSAPVASGNSPLPGSPTGPAAPPPPTGQ